MINDCYIAARGLHLGACLLLFGFWFFDLWIFRTRPQTPEVRRLMDGLLARASLILWPLVFLSALAWFGVVAINMSGLPPTEAWQSETLGTVWQQTAFGRVWQIRLGLGFVGLIGTTTLLVHAHPRNRQRTLLALNLLALTALLASLAWAGHGLVGNATTSRWHPWVDTLHLIISGIWPAGLLPLALILPKLKEGPGNLAIINRFSVTSLLCVALLTVTGVANSWVLVGSWHNLFHTTYGWLLDSKILLFFLTIGLGADNLLRLKPSLNRSPLSPDPLTYSRLQRNLQCELALATAILLVIAILGTLAPGQS